MIMLEMQRALRTENTTFCIKMTTSEIISVATFVHLVLERESRLFQAHGPGSNPGRHIPLKYVRERRRCRREHFNELNALRGDSSQRAERATRATAHENEGTTSSV